jgi:hypothetical protein
MSPIFKFSKNVMNLQIPAQKLTKTIKNKQKAQKKLAFWKKRIRARKTLPHRNTWPKYQTPEDLCQS